MQGRRFSSAISCARRCFFTVTGKYVPPFTVASFATTTTSMPCTRPMPVTSPAPGAAPSYMPCAASGENSRNGEPASSSARMRSRGSSLPRSVCFARALSPPPSAACAICSLRSSTTARSCAALAWNSGERVSIWDSMTGIASFLGDRAMKTHPLAGTPAFANENGRAWRPVRGVRAERQCAFGSCLAASTALFAASFTSSAPFLAVSAACCALAAAACPAALACCAEAVAPATSPALACCTACCAEAAACCACCADCVAAALVASAAAFALAAASCAACCALLLHAASAATHRVAITKCLSLNFSLEVFTRWSKRRMRAAGCGRRGSLQQRDRQRGRFAAADAQRRDTFLAAARLERVNQGDDQTRAGRADRMAERARAAVDVELVVRHAEFAHRRHRHHRERFVDFEQVDVGNLPADLLQQLVDRGDRRSGEPLRLLRLRAMADNARERLETALVRFVLAHHHGCRGAVGDARRTRGSDRAVLAERGTQRGDFRHVGFAGLFVGGDFHVAFLAGHFHRHDFRGKRAGRNRRLRALDRFGRERV